MAQPTADPVASPAGSAPPKPKRRPFTACGPAAGHVGPGPSVDTSPYRAPLLQFIWDWNVAEDRPALIAEAPIYHGDDGQLLPAIAVVVHALADRDGVALQGWVFRYRSPQDVMLFPWEFEGDYARWVAAAVSERVRLPSGVVPSPDAG